MLFLSFARLTSQFFFFFVWYDVTIDAGDLILQARSCTYWHAPSDDRRSDLIETCQGYCRGPADVPFQGLISIRRAIPKLRPFTCQPMTGHGAMTSRMTSQLMFIYLFIFARLTLQFFFFFVWYDVTIDAGDLSMCLFKV